MSLAWTYEYPDSRVQIYPFIAHYCWLHPESTFQCITCQGSTINHLGGQWKFPQANFFSETPPPDDSWSSPYSNLDLQLFTLPASVLVKVILINKMEIKHKVHLPNNLFHIKTCMKLRNQIRAQVYFGFGTEYKSLIILHGEILCLFANFVTFICQVLTFWFMQVCSNCIMMS